MNGHINLLTKLSKGQTEVVKVTCSAHGLPVVQVWYTFMEMDRASMDGCVHVCMYVVMVLTNYGKTINHCWRFKLLIYNSYASLQQIRGLGNNDHFY